MKFASAIFSTLAAVSSVTAHGMFQQLWVNGVDQASTCINTPTSNSPLMNVNATSIACNLNTPAEAKCAVPAGATVDVEMHQQTNDRDCTHLAVGGNHDGPILVYLAKVDDALTADPNTADWFKVGELGLIRPDYWGTDVLNANCGRYAFKIPPCIPSGDYLIRAEIIALHVAYSPGGAQFYTSCFPITVSGGGSTLPSHTVKFPGAYSSTDPGILYDLYDGYTSYPIPGPPVWACSSVGEPTTVSPQPTAVPSPSSTLLSTPPASTTSEAVL